MVAEHPEMTPWTVWALRGADAGQLLNSRQASPNSSSSRNRPQKALNIDNSHIGRQVQELREKLSASRVSLQAQEAQAHRASLRRARSKSNSAQVGHCGMHGMQRNLHESPVASPSNGKVTVTSPSETKRSTAASSERLSPRYEGQPMTEGIAVWRETQALNENLGASAGAHAHRPLRSVPAHARGTMASPTRQRPTTLAEGLEPTTQPLAAAQPMPPWASTFGLHGMHPGPLNGLPGSPQSSYQIPPFAEAAMSRLTWLQAEKEALEGWLSNAGYLSVSNDSDDRARSSEHVSYGAQEPTVRHHDPEGTEVSGRLQGEQLQSARASEEPQGHLPLQLAEPERRANDRPLHHGYATGHTPTSSVEDGAPSTPSSARRKSFMHQTSYNTLTAERAAAQAKLEDDIKAIGLERWSDPPSPASESKGKIATSANEHLRSHAATASFGVPRNSAPASALASLRAAALGQPGQAHQAESFPEGVPELGFWRACVEHAQTARQTGGQGCVDDVLWSWLVRRCP